MQRFRVVIVGAGPYGLSVAAFLQKLDVSYVVVGRPMEFWQSHMPESMFIRTKIEYSSFCDPAGRFTIEQYAKEKDVPLSYPMPRPVFVDYGNWFIQQTGIAIAETHVARIAKADDHFAVVLEDGERLQAESVVIAVGIMYAHYMPEHLAPLPKRWVSHTSMHTTYAPFAGQHVAVLGGGQSAWEAAVLLHQAGAEPELIYRRERRIPEPGSVNQLLRQLSYEYYDLPDSEKEKYRHQYDIPHVSNFLAEMAAGKIPEHPSTAVEEAVVEKDGLCLRLKNLRHGTVSEMTVDHLICATGYRYDVARLPFLDERLMDRIAVRDGYPVLDRHFQSTCEGIYFVGPSAYASFGPSYRVMSGIPHTCHMLSKQFSKTY